MDISPLRFHTGTQPIAKKASHQAAFGPGEKFGIWKDCEEMSFDELKAHISTEPWGGLQRPDASKDSFELHEQFAAENSTFDWKSQLSDEEWAALRNKYDLDNMTSDDYLLLIDDLCRMGVFKEEDKTALTSPTMLTPIALQSDSGLQTIGKTRLVSEDAFSPYDIYNPTDIFTWVNYRASNEYFDPDKQDYCKTKDALLYQRLGQVLDCLL